MGERAAVRCAGALRVPGAVVRAPLASAGPSGAVVRRQRCDVTRPFPSKIVLPVLVDELPGAAGPPVRRHRQPPAVYRGRRLGRDVRRRRAGAVELVQARRRRRGRPSCARDRSRLRRARARGPGVPRRRRPGDAGVRGAALLRGLLGRAEMVAPGLAALETIAELHSAARIGDARATWGISGGNPVHDPIRAIAARADVTFALDVALGGDKGIAGGGSPATSRPSTPAAMAHVRSTAMVGVAAPYGRRRHDQQRLPADQNLYQCVKGLKAAAGITRDGGTIILAAECEDGLPAHGSYAGAAGGGRLARRVPGRARLGGGSTSGTSGRSRSRPRSARVVRVLAQTPGRLGGGPRSGRG